MWRIWFFVAERIIRQCLSIEAMNLPSQEGTEYQDAISFLVKRVVLKILA